jgi:hypothetical protein
MSYLRSSLTVTNVDLLEVELVDPKGDVKTINQFTDPDHFYAVRGGGGNSWGVSFVRSSYKFLSLMRFLGHHLGHL